MDWRQKWLGGLTISEEIVSLLGGWQISRDMNCDYKWKWKNHDYDMT